MDELAMFLMITFCDYSPLVTDYGICVNEITQCKTDDVYTMKECIVEYKEELEYDKI